MGCIWSPADPHLTILTSERDRAGREVAVPSAIHVKITKLCVTSCFSFNSVSYREHVLESRGSTQSVSYRDLQASCGSKRCRCGHQCLIPPLCYGMSFRIVTVQWAGFINYPRGEGLFVIYINNG